MTRSYLVSFACLQFGIDVMPAQKRPCRYTASMADPIVGKVKERDAVVLSSAAVTLVGEGEGKAKL